jgi:hypothetical protein
MRAAAHWWGCRSRRAGLCLSGHPDAAKHSRAAAPHLHTVHRGPGLQSRPQSWCCLRSWWCRLMKKMWRLQSQTWGLLRSWMWCLRSCWMQSRQARTDNTTPTDARTLPQSGTRTQATDCRCRQPYRQTSGIRRPRRRTASTAPSVHWSCVPCRVLCDVGVSVMRDTIQGVRIAVSGIRRAQPVVAARELLEDKPAGLPPSASTGDTVSPVTTHSPV